jgi:hypothetical protein
MLHLHCARQDVLLTHRKGEDFPQSLLRPAIFLGATATKLAVDLAKIEQGLCLQLICKEVMRLDFARTKLQPPDPMAYQDLPSSVITLYLAVANVLYVARRGYGLPESLERPTVKLAAMAAKFVSDLMPKEFNLAQYWPGVQKVSD